MDMVIMKSLWCCFCGSHWRKLCCLLSMDRCPLCHRFSHLVHCSGILASRSLFSPSFTVCHSLLVDFCDIQPAHGCLFERVQKSWFLENLATNRDSWKDFHSFYPKSTIWSTSACFSTTRSQSRFKSLDWPKALEKLQTRHSDALQNTLLLL